MNEPRKLFERRGPEREKQRRVAYSLFANADGFNVPERSIGRDWRIPNAKRGIRRPEATVGRLYSRKARRLVEKLFAYELERFDYAFPGGERENGA